MLIRDPQYKMLKKFCFAIGILVAFLYPLHSIAQDQEDTTVIAWDSTSLQNEDDYENKAGKFFDEAVFRSVPDSTVARMQKEKEFAYANDPAYWVKEKKVYKKGFWDYVFDFFASDIVRVLFYIFLGALILFVLYRIVVVNDLLIFYSSKKKQPALDVTEAAELDPRQIDRKIQDAIDGKNFNAAVRYLYLKTLYALNDKNWIRFHPEATNNEYVNQMSQHKNIRDFQFLTRIYEYVWYGKFEINELQFATVHQNFKKFHGAI